MAINLNQLHAELAAAGINVPALGHDGRHVHSYDDKGNIVPLPKAAAKVIKAHKPQPTAREAALEALRASDHPDTRNLLIALGLD